MADKTEGELLVEGLARLAAVIRDRDAAADGLDAGLAAVIRDRDAAMAELDAGLAGMDARLAELEAEGAEQAAIISGLRDGTARRSAGGAHRGGPGPPPPGGSPSYRRRAA